MKAPRFNREQMQYLVALAIGNALDAIESSLPYNTSEADWKRMNNDDGGFIDEQTANLGRFLSCLYAGQTDDGLGTTDAVDSEPNLGNYLSAFPNKQIAYWKSVVVPLMAKADPSGTGVSSYAPEYQHNAVTAIADQWIDKAFGRAFFD